MWDPREHDVGNTLDPIQGNMYIKRTTCKASYQYAVHFSQTSRSSIFFSLSRLRIQDELPQPSGGVTSISPTADRCCFWYGLDVNIVERLEM